MITRRSSCLFILLALYCFSLAACPVLADMGGYTVQPVPPGMAPGTPFETVKVPEQDYTPQDYAIIFALSVSPLLLCPVELLFLFKIYAFLGFRRILRKNVLDHPSRSVILQFIHNSPGTDFSEISRETGVPQNSLRYHLAILKLNHKVTVLETSRNTRYYENSGRYSVTEQKILKYLHNTPTRTLLKLIKENPSLTRVQLENALRISGAGVNWHMHRLSDDGVLAIRKEGRNARYEINHEVLPYLEKYLPLFEASADTKGTR